MGACIKRHFALLIILIIFPQGFQKSKLKLSRFNNQMVFLGSLALLGLLGIVQFANAYLISFVFTILIYYILAPSWELDCWSRWGMLI
jgi:hypothetical protein